MIDFQAGQIFTALVATLGVLLFPGDVTDTMVINFCLGYGGTALALAIIGRVVSR